MKKTPLLLLVGPLGSGKSTIAHLLEQRNGWKELDSYTTRPKRTPDETGHTFINEEDFCILKDLVAYTEINGFRYGATKRQVEDADMYIIDVLGAEILMRNYHGDRKLVAVSILCDPETMRTRMAQRGDSPEEIKGRVACNSTAYNDMTNRLIKLFGKENVLEIENRSSEEAAITIESWLRSRLL